MGEVWRARHRLLARPAALKLIRRDVLGSNRRVQDAICLAKDPAARPASAAVLAARLAAAAPQNAWTADAARAWWELHGMALTAAALDADAPALDEQAPVQKAGDRCWPRLDRKGVRQQPG